MVFTQSNIDSFRKVISSNATSSGSFGQLSQRDPGTIEFEIRFGYFTVEKRAKDGRDISVFHPGVSRRTFNRLRKMKSSSFSHTRDDYYPNVKGRFTAVFDTNGTPIQQYHTDKVELGRPFDYPPYGLRIDISREIQDDLPRPVGDPQMIRVKKRWSFSLKGNFRLDITEVITYGGIYPGMKYEVEIESLNPVGLDLTSLNSITSNILLEVQGSLILYTMDERFQVIADFNRNTGSTWDGNTIDHTVLDQVRNIKIRDMVDGGLISNPTSNKIMRYGVGIKPDGYKKYLFIHSSGIYLMQAPGEVSKFASTELASQVKDYHGTIIQGEYIPNSSLNDNIPSKRIYMLLYDCLSNGGTSVKHLPFEARQIYIDNVINIFSKQSQVLFEKKIFQRIDNPHQFFQLVSTILNATYPYKTDGLVFQPLDHKYDSSVQLIPLHDRKLTIRPDILKWKPVELLSIDFELNRTENGLELMVNRRGNRNERLAFKGSNDYPFNPNTDIFPDSQELLNSPNGTIIEFIWDASTKKLTPFKLRDEKPHPNNDDIALDIWEDIHQPISEELIRGNIWGLMYRYHNRLKTNLFRMIPPPKIIISIGSGAGADVYKWVNIGVTHVLAVEPNDQNRSELRRRLSFTNIQYRDLATTGQDVQTIYNGLKEFLNAQADVLEYMLSLSFFFDSDQSLSSILMITQYMIKPGGHLLAFTIDGRKVVEYFKNPNNRIVEDNVMKAKLKGIEFQLRMPPNESLPEITVQTIPDSRYSIYIDIPGSIVRNQTEYLVNIPRLTASLEQYGWKLINEKPATTESFMTADEQIFSSMFTSLVFQKSS